jgi:hypothetical protein
MAPSGRLLIDATSPPFRMERQFHRLAIGSSGFRLERLAITCCGFTSGMYPPTGSLCRWQSSRCQSRS